MLYLILALLAGASIVISRLINFKLAEKIGLLQGTFFNNLVGLLVSLICLLFSQELAYFIIPKHEATHAFAYLGGFIGVIVVALSSFMTPKISSFYLTLFIFIGQLVVGGIIDYLTLGDFSIGKIIGGVFVLAGLIYNLVLDRPTKTTEHIDSLPIN